MSTTEAGVGAPASRGPSPWIPLAISLFAAGGVAALAWSARTGGDESRLGTLGPDEVAALNLNLGHTIDAARHAGAKPEVGRRYSVRLDQAAREGADAVARIGGMVTFVAGGRVGETRVVEVTAVKKTVAEAVVVAEAAPEPAPAPEPAAEPVEAPAPPAPVNAHTGTVEGVGSKGDGRLKVDGLTVYIPGAATGERIVFEIVENKGRYALGRLVGRLSSDGSAPPAAAAAGSAVERPRAGAEYTVTIEEKAHRNPDLDGVARIGGMVVIVPGTQPGETVKIRVTSVRERSALAEVVPAADAQP